MQLRGGPRLQVFELICESLGRWMRTIVVVDLSISGKGPATKKQRWYLYPGLLHPTYSIITNIMICIYAIQFTEMYYSCLLYEKHNLCHCYHHFKLISSYLYIVTRCLQQQAPGLDAFPDTFLHRLSNFTNKLSAEFSKDFSARNIQLLTAVLKCLIILCR